MSFLFQPVTLFPVKPQRQIGSISVQVVLNESTTDNLTITKQPVQQGASISDHAYLEPTTLSMTIYQEANFSNSLSKIYASFLDLQQSRVPFTIVTPKRIYKSMLMSACGMTNDKLTENILALHLTFQQIIIVSVTTVQVPRSQQKSPGTTGATQKAGQKQSALYQGSQAATAFGKFAGFL